MLPGAEESFERNQSAKTKHNGHNEELAIQNAKTPEKDLVFLMEKKSQLSNSLIWKVLIRSY